MLHHGQTHRQRTQANHRKQTYRRGRALLKEHGLWEKAASIIANGSLMYEPPNYAHQLNRMRHRAEAAEKELAELKRKAVADG